MFFFILSYFKKLLEFSWNESLNSKTIIEVIITPEYIVIVEIAYPTLVFGARSPNPAVDIVMKVNQTKF